MTDSGPDEKVFHISFDAKTAPHDEAIRHAFETGIPPYTLIRGLRTKMIGEEMVLGYNESLPKFRGQDLLELVRTFHEKTLDVVRVADIGYGAGHLLLDLTNEFGFVKALGFGRDAYAKLDTPSFGIKPTLDQLSGNPRITLVDGDPPFSNDQIPPSSQNIVVVNNVLQYVPIHEAEIVADLVKTLSPGGISLLNQVGLEDTDILELLQKNGVRKENIEIYKSSHPNIGKTLAFMK